MYISLKDRTVNRELSWLSFNYRVLQEAQDPRVPLIERLRFLGIFSNNLDEFFRVRVATMKRIKAVSRKKELLGDKRPSDVLEEIQAEVLRQKEIFADTFDVIIRKLEDHNIVLIDEWKLSSKQEEFVEEYYREQVAPLLVPIMLRNVPAFPYLRDKSIYLAVKLTSESKAVKKQLALIEIPSEKTSRFVELPERKGKKYIMFLDDVIRFNMEKIFGIFKYDKAEAYTIKITRDAELDLDDDISKGFYERMKKTLKQRKTGQPVRFLYDKSMPADLLKKLTDGLKIGEEDNIIAGGRYHNSKDFMKFPNVGGPELEWDKLVQLEHSQLKQSKSILESIEKRDILLHYPYQHFRSFVHYLRESAIDPNVREIKITIYRAAKSSRVMNALISAAKNGKEVTAIIELKARFDEENNLEWSKKLQDAGIKVNFGITGMKVHSKLALVTKVIDGKPRYYSAIATGNFHEGTAKIYSDFALFTANQEICEEAQKVFAFIERPYLNFRFKHLLVAPASMRSKFISLINREIKNAREGIDAYLVIKVNSLVDETLIRKLYQASKYGVKIRIIARGICCLIPGIPNLSENIEVRSIVGRFLEHSRVFIFANSGREDIYISSGDWMERNLDHRVEVACAIYDENIRKEIRDFIELQWRDNTRARLIEGRQLNKFVEKEEGEESIEAQKDLYDVIKRHHESLQS